MVYKITIILAILLVINFLLLMFSCNKTKTSIKADSKPVLRSTKVTNLPPSQELAPTGS
jgi:preprotein translocase subunit SecG